MASREKTVWVFDEDGNMREVRARTRDHDGGMQRRKITAKDRQNMREQEGRGGLWTGSGNTFFDNARTMRTIDKSEYEQELGQQAWLTSIVEKRHRYRRVI